MSYMTLCPKPLPDNGRIAVIAPSSRGDVLPENVAVLQDLGFEVVVHPQCEAAQHQSAGTPQVRAGAIMDVFLDAGVDAIFCARGGNRVMHALPHLDFDAIKAHPKPLIGFSDATALLNAIYAQTGLITYHGPSVSRLSKAQSFERKQMVDALQGKADTLDFGAAHTLVGGTAKGRLIGGNLSVFSALVGTPYMPDCTGAILFFEDIGDQLSRYDRMLAQLRLAGILGQAAGIVFGQMIADGDSSVTPFGFSVEDILREHTQDLGVPVIMNAPFGHSGLLCTLPIGGMAELDADALALRLV